MIQIANKIPSDATVRQRVASALNERHPTAFRSFEIKVVQGVVTLTGKVQSFYQRQIAITTCQKVAGVFSLIDEVEVQQDGEEPSRRLEPVAVATAPSPKFVMNWLI